MINTHKLIYLYSACVVVEINSNVKDGEYIVEYNISQACYKLIKVSSEIKANKVIACSVEFESLIEDGISPINQSLEELLKIYFNPKRKVILEEDDIVDAANYGAWYINNAQNAGLVPRGNTLQWLSNRGLYVDVSGEETEENGITINVMEK